MVGRLSVCAVPVQTRGSWGCEWGWVWRRVAGCGLGFYCSSALTFVALGPVLLTFCQVEEAHEVDLDGTSSPTSRGYRVLEVVPPYLRAVYLNRPATRNGRSSSARCPEHIITQCS